MPVLQSKINVKSDGFANNAQHMQTLVDDLTNKVSTIKKGGGESAAERHLARGKLLPRDRINALLDADTPFLEIGQQCVYSVSGKQFPPC